MARRINSFLTNYCSRHLPLEALRRRQNISIVTQMIYGRSALESRAQSKNIYRVACAKLVEFSRKFFHRFIRAMRFILFKELFVSIVHPRFEDEARCAVTESPSVMWHWNSLPELLENKIKNWLRNEKRKSCSINAKVVRIVKAAKNIKMLPKHETDIRLMSRVAFGNNDNNRCSSFLFLDEFAFALCVCKCENWWAVSLL